MNTSWKWVPWSYEQKITNARMKHLLSKRDPFEESPKITIYSSMAFAC